jgi:hypothetical protein
MPRATPALPIEQTDQQQLQQWASAFGTPRKSPCEARLCWLPPRMKRAKFKRSTIRYRIYEMEY